ncbi:branched-chain amino acid ABC transporter permease [Bradyrhizobium sp. AS23.2]|uniref:branched-chain amino acid ABC transporter permease n=1 Tax=Bradyrhizobium sp. AS23.2 TaxID=1680155 RepID=UPI0009397B07|nr:branched-chain amino acid ABC transporter permease [Bradyrhizobium sp. AS23.2]OKO81311.1 ABC transporter permease [Bradyrhizobium sp. AS23.2]
MDLFLQALSQGILVGGTYALIALGMAVIFSVSGMLNFAHGDFLLIGMYLAYAVFLSLNLDPYLSVLITFPVMCLAGAGLYVFLLKRLGASHLLMAVQLTLGLSFIAQNTLLLTFGGEPIRVPSVVETDLLLVGNVIIRTPQLIAFFAALLLSAAFYATLNFTDAGRRVRAVQQQPRAAALIGINVPLVRTLTFALGIGVLAIAAVLIIPGTSMAPAHGLRWTVIALITVVLGGMTNFVGIFIGALLIGASESLATLYVSGTLGMIVPYALFIALVLFRPEGILKRT